MFDIAGLVNEACMSSATQDKAIRGFEVCGIWPINENIFSDEDFLPSLLTDEPIIDADHQEQLQTRIQLLSISNYSKCVCTYLLHIPCEKPEYKLVSWMLI